MQQLYINIKTNKQQYINKPDHIPEDLILALQQAKAKRAKITNLKDSIKTKLVNIGFTKNECKYIIH